MQDGHIYLIKCLDRYKIGITDNIYNRLNGFRTSLPRKFEYIGSCRVNNYKELEKYLHNTYSEQRTRGEWFNLTKNHVRNIKELITYKGRPDFISGNFDIKKLLKDCDTLEDIFIIGNSYRLNNNKSIKQIEKFKNYLKDSSTLNEFKSIKNALIFYRGLVYIDKDLASHDFLYNKVIKENNIE
jgi:hypothetical protein